MIPHSRPTLGDKERAAADAVLRSGQLACGPEVEEFERRFARAIGMPDAVAVNSGTSGLHLALLALGVGTGDEVIIPSYVCSALLHAVRYAGATPVLADSLPEHGHMDNGKAISKISKKTKAVILTHLFGDATAAKEWKKTGLSIIEDATQSLGCETPEGPVGSLGDVSVFSFYATKIITTGEGGMIGVRDAKVAAILRDIREYDEKGKFRARYNYKMTDLAAAIGLAQLESLPAFVRQRRDIAARYDAAAVSAGWKPHNQRGSMVYRYVLSCEPDAGAAQESFASRGVQCKRPVYQPLHRVLSLSDKDFPRASMHHERNLSIPLYPSLQSGEIQTILEALSVTRNVDVR